MSSVLEAQGSNSADRGIYRSPIKEVLTSAAGVKHATLWV